MRVKLTFEHGEQVELSCLPEDFAPVVLTQRFTVSHALPRIAGFTFIQNCAYCNAPFETSDPRQKYESQSHRKLASLYGLPSVKHRKPQEK